ncbi:VOC family protein [Massilia sp. W12]|uniref:VOC family protein n=1 Tax=Massilia sp. W12 TaxID=3126507 RepID=UPI0030CDB514
MSVTLHHINISAPAQTLRAVRDFYCALLDLQEGARPAFNNPGYWLYAGPHALLHLTQRSESHCRSTQRQHSTLDHVAFACSDLPALRQRLADMQCAFREVQIAALCDQQGQVVIPAQIQLFLQDPGGNQIELNFELRQAA